MRLPALQKFYSRLYPGITDIISEKRISFVLWTTRETVENIRNL